MDIGTKFILVYGIDDNLAGIIYIYIYIFKHHTNSNIFISFSDYDTRLSKSENNQEMNPAIEKAMNALKFVAQHVKNEDNFNSVREAIKNKLHYIVFNGNLYILFNAALHNILNVHYSFSLLMTGNT